MFTFLHTADIHLDSPLVGLSQKENAPVELLRGATRTALERLVDLALERAVDFVLVAGDLYDGDWKDYGTGLFFVGQMRRLEAAGIPVYLIFGNHDAESTTTKSLSLPANVHVFPTRKPESVDHPGLPVTVHGQGFASPAVTENLAARYPAPVSARFNIGLLHTNLGDRAGHGNYAPSTVPQLVARGYDYWALGHSHQRETHHERPHVVYPGNLQGRHINETGAKGCLLVAVDDALEVSGTEFCAVDSVRWQRLAIDCSEMQSEPELYDAVRDTLEEAVQMAEDRLLAVRLVFGGASRLHEIVHADQSRILAECVSQAAGIGSDCIWIQGLELKTRTLLDPEDLAKRDDLTALVLESLASFDPGVVPAPVKTLEGKLPDKAKQGLAACLRPESDAERESIREDVAAIVLQAIAASGSPD